MNCSQVLLRSFFLSALLLAFLSLPAMAQDAARPAKMNATEVVIENGKVVFKARRKKEDAEAEAEMAKPEWLIDVKAGTERPYPLKPIPNTTPLMCRPAGFTGGL